MMHWCVMVSLYKALGTFMGELILDAILQYMVSAFFKLFFKVGKGLINELKLMACILDALIIANNKYIHALTEYWEVLPVWLWLPVLIGTSDNTGVQIVMFPCYNWGVYPTARADICNIVKVVCALSVHVRM